MVIAINVCVGGSGVSSLLTLLFRMCTKQTPTANKYILYAYTNRQHMEQTHTHIAMYVFTYLGCDRAL